MDTFIGHIKTPQDALIIFEACRRGQLNRVQRRLSSKERVHITSGSVFAWDEREAGVRRWTDGRTWSPSRVLGSFLTYRELNTKHRRRHLSISSSISSSSSSSSSLSSSSSSLNKANHASQYPRSSAGCSYKPNGLIKQSFSICTVNNQKIHLISYYTKADVASGRLMQPSHHPQLSKISIPKGYYPELNPLDTSGGHSATLHSMRTELTRRKLSLPSNLSETSEPISIPRSMSLSLCTIQSPDISPSLTSSPSSSDEDMAELTDEMFNYPSLTTQDIIWGNLSCSEDKRQLQALEGQLRI